jgi:hypothetical protein
MVTDREAVGTLLKEVTEIPADLQCTMQYAMSVAEIARFLSDQLETSRYIAVNVLKKEAAEETKIGLTAGVLLGKTSEIEVLADHKTT